MWAILVGAAIIVVLIGASFAGGYYFFGYVFRRKADDTVIKKLIKATEYTGSAHQEAAKKGLELMKTLPHEDAYAFSKDALKLHGHLFCFEEHPKKFILGMHGYKSKSLNEFAPYIAFYRSIGFSMLLPDNRAHGESEGKYVGMGNLDRLDCIQWAEYLVNRFGPDIQIILHGISMGGATVLSAAGEQELPKQVIGVISDCAYTSLKDEFKHGMHELFHLPTFPCIRICEKICRKKLKFNFTKNSPIEQVQKAKVPILFVHGNKDTVVPHWMGHILCDRCKVKKRLLTVEGANHAQSIAVSPVEYHEAIKSFFGIGA